MSIRNISLVRTQDSGTGSRTTRYVRTTLHEVKLLVTLLVPNWLIKCASIDSENAENFKIIPLPNEYVCTENFWMTCTIFRCHSGHATQSGSCATGQVWGNSRKYCSFWLANLRNGVEGNFEVKVIKLQTFTHATENTLSWRFYLFFRITNKWTIIRIG